jgi:gliding motility-associated-like protein
MVTTEGTPCEVFVPNIFSPNADGQNDVLYLRGNGIAAMEFCIYSRWGEQVYCSTNQNQGWDGTYNGQPVQPGVFAWSAALTFDDGRQQTASGTVTVVR